MQLTAAYSVGYLVFNLSIIDVHGQSMERRRWMRCFGGESFPSCSASTCIHHAYILCVHIHACMYVFIYVCMHVAVCTCVGMRLP